MSDHTETMENVREGPKKSALREIVDSLVIAVVLALLIRAFAF